MTQVLVTRAEPGAGQTARRLIDRGFTPVMAPLLRVAAIPDAALDTDGAQAVLFSSANGVRAYAELGGRTDLPALCVGEATALAARDSGFADVRSAEGDASGLAMLAGAVLNPARGAVLWASGEDIARDVGAVLRQSGFATRRAVLYRARPAEALPEAASRALAAGALDAILFHSARAAQVLAPLAQGPLARGVGRAVAVCFSPRVAESVRALGPTSIAVAASPDEESLLAALDKALGGAVRRA